MVPPIFEGFVSIIKIVIKFFENEEAGSKAVWNFSENSSDLVG